VPYIFTAVNDHTLAVRRTDLLHSRYQALLEISEAIASHRELDQLFRDLAPRLHRVVEFDFANLILYEPTRKSMRSHVLETPETAYACPPGECPMETVGGLFVVNSLVVEHAHQIPACPPLEEAFLPNAEKVLEKARWLYRY